jgi:predicted RNase H-like HicB family nuclease
MATTMKRITAIIEKASDGGYGIYAEGNLPLFSSGLTEDEAREEFETLVREQAEFMKERQGEYPDWYSDDVQIDYRYDMSGFFLAFPFINVSEFAKSLDINPSLMRKYKSGIAKAGERQKDLIQRKFDDIVTRLSAVRF